MSIRAGTAGDAGPPGASTNRRALFTVVLVVFLDLVGFGIVVPILPFYVRTFAGSEVFIGLLAASYSLLQFAFAPVLGRLSDRYGRRPVILASLTGSALAWTVFGVGGALWVLFVSRMLAGAMGGNLAAVQAYVADVTPREDRAGALGLVGAAFGLGFVFGPAIGGFFASPPVVDAARAVLPAAVPATQYSVPSFAAAAFSVVALVVAAAFLVEPDRAAAGERSTDHVPADSGGRAAPEAPSAAGGNRSPGTGRPTPGDRRHRSWAATLLAAVRGWIPGRASDDGDADADPAKTARSRRFRALVVAFFVVSVAFSGVQVMFIPFTADVFDYDATQAALLLTYIGVLGVINQGVLVGRLARRFPEDRLATAGAALLVVALAVLPFSREVGAAVFGWVPTVAFLTPGLTALLAALALLSAGNGLLSVSLTTLVSAAATDDTQGTAFGVTQGAGSLGRTVGPPAMAALYAAWAYWSPFVVGAVLMIPVVAIAVRLGRTDNM